MQKDFPSFSGFPDTPVTDQKAGHTNRFFFLSFFLLFFFPFNLQADYEKNLTFFFFFIPPSTLYSADGTKLQCRPLYYYSQRQHLIGCSYGSVNNFSSPSIFQSKDAVWGGCWQATNKMSFVQFIRNSLVYGQLWKALSYWVSITVKARSFSKRGHQWTPPIGNLLLYLAI